jgi:hypothetical protein
MNQPYPTPLTKIHNNQPTDQNAYCCTDCPMYTDHCRTPPLAGPRCCQGCVRYQECEDLTRFVENNEKTECCSKCSLFKYCYAVTWFAEAEDVVQILNRNMQEDIVNANPIHRHEIDEALQQAHQEIISRMSAALKTEIDLHARTQTIPEYDMDANTPSPKDITFDRGYDVSKVPSQLITAEVMLAAYYVVLLTNYPNPEYEEYKTQANLMLDSLIDPPNMMAGVTPYTENPVD